MNAVLQKKNDSNHRDVVKGFGVACCKCILLRSSVVYFSKNVSHSFSFGIVHQSLKGFSVNVNNFETVVKGHMKEHLFRLHESKKSSHLT